MPTRAASFLSPVDLRELGRAEVGVRGDRGRVRSLGRRQPLVDHGRVQPGPYVDLVRVGLALGVGRRGPVRVARQDQVLAVVLVRDDLVRAGRDRVLLVLRARVLALRDGGELRLRGQVRELALGLVQVEDDGPLVRRLDRREPLLVLVGALVAAAADQPVPQVGGTAGELGGEGALDAVLDVGRGDRRAVLVLQALLQGVRPDGRVLVGAPGVGGEVGDDLGAGRAVLAVAGGERTEHQGRDVSAAGGVQAGRVEVLLRGGVQDRERAALVGRGVAGGRLGIVVLRPAGGGARCQNQAYGYRGHTARCEGRWTHRRRPLEG